MSKTLVIYYSRRGENYVNGKLLPLEKGNTEIVAECIKEAVGADLFQVDTVNSYSESYMACIEEAKKELNSNERPALKEYLESIEDYDNIVVAGPCWWGTYPMAIFSQLDKLDFTGKTVYAVMTHEGSGLGSSEADLKKYCIGAKYGKSLAIHGGSVATARGTVEDWAKKYLI